MKLSDIYRKLVFTQSVRLEMYELIADYLEDGIPEPDCVDMLKRSAVVVGDMSSGVLVDIYSEVQKRLSSGRYASIAEAFKGFLPDDEFMLITSAKNAAQGFRNVIQAAKVAQELKQEIRSNLSSPIVLYLMLIGMFIFVGSYLMPMLLDVFPNVDAWPPLARYLYVFSTAFIKYGAFFFVLFLIFVVSVYWSLSHWVSSRRNYVDRKISIYKLYRDISANIFLISLSSQIKMQVSLKEALENMLVYASPYMRFHLQKMLISLRASKPDAEALDTGLLNPIVAMNVRDYSRISNFGESIEKIANRLTKRTKDKVFLFAKAMQFLSYALFALLALWVYGGVALLASSLSVPTM